MATTGNAKTNNDEVITPISNQKRWKKRPWSDAEFLRLLRQEREGFNDGRRFEHFFGTPLHLKVDLPLPEYATNFSYPAYRAEQLQDLCNKATIIYGTDSNTLGRALYPYIRGIWSHGDIHTTDIEFGRFFAKFIKTSRSDSERPTTQDVLALHGRLLDASLIAKATGFTKGYPAVGFGSGIGDVSYKAHHQIEFFNIKPLGRALIVIIENPTKRRDSNFEKQMVRLVRTGWTSGLSEPITFQGLDVKYAVNEDEVVVLLPEAIRFIMDQDEKEDALQEKRDPSVLETWLGDPEIRITKIGRAVKASEPIWTAGILPSGPSPEWWELAKTLE